MNVKKGLFCLVLAMIVGGCTSNNPPYNDFQSGNKEKSYVETGAVVATGVTVGMLTTPLIGIGTTALGSAVILDNLRGMSTEKLIQKLAEEDVQVVKEGRRITLIVPTDKYYLTDSYELNDLQYEGLNNIVALVLKTSQSKIYVAGFTDDGISGLSNRTTLSQGQAESMADLLWANGVPLRRLVIVGHGHHYDIADNDLIHGAAMNRRVEIQWETQACLSSDDLFCHD